MTAADQPRIFIQWSIAALACAAHVARETEVWKKVFADAGILLD